MLYLAAALMLMAWLVPDHFPPWVSWHNEVWAFSAVLVLSAAGLARCKRHTASAVKVPKLAWLLALACGVVWVQLVLGRIEYFGIAFVVSLYLFAALLALTCGFNAVIDKQQASARHVEYFAAVIVVGAVASTFIALCQTFEVWEELGLISRLAQARRPGGNVNQANHLATLLVIGLASLAYLYEVRWLRYWATLAIFVVLVLGIAVTESRTAILSVGVLFAWVLLRYRQNRLRMPIAAPLACFAAIALAFLYWPSCYSMLQSGGVISGQAMQVNTNAGTRFMVWPQLIDAVLQRPWFGWGVGGVSKALNAVLDRYASSDQFTYAHNVVLDSAVGVGIPLTALAVGLGCWWLFTRVRWANSPVSWYGMAVLVPFGVHSMLEFPFAYAYLLLPVMFAVGMLEAAVKPTGYASLSWRSCVGGVVAVTVLMVWSAKEYVAAEQDFREARFNAFKVGQTVHAYEPSQIYLLTQLNDLMAATRLDLESDPDPSDIEFLRKVAIHFPSPINQRRYAFALAIKGNAPEAARQFQVMKAMYGEKLYVLVKSDWNEFSRKKDIRPTQIPLP